MDNSFEEEDTDLRLIIIWVITAFATISVFTGLDVGIRRLSEGNFFFCLILVFYIFIICDPFFLTNFFIQTVGYHINHIFELTFFTDAFQQVGMGDSPNYEYFMSWWTVFYWAWWVAWSPFVGIFIAQISRGRTIREFILGNVFVPTLFTSMWMCIFGGVGLYMEVAFDGAMGNYADGVYYEHYVMYNDDNQTKINEGYFMEFKTATELGYNDSMVTVMYSNATGVCEADELTYGTYKQNNVAYLECFGTATMLFEMIDSFPLGGLMNVLAGMGIVTYFVTSSDSASHVIDVLTANGNEEPPKLQRIFWAFSEGAVASVLISQGGSAALTALQTVSIVSGLPFTIIMLFLCYAFVYALKVDMGEIDPEYRHDWSLPFFDASNPSVVYFGDNGEPPKGYLGIVWLKALFIPCIQNFQNYREIFAIDVAGRVYGKSKFNQVMWAFFLIGPMLCIIIFLLLGIEYEGWPEVAVVFYIFYVGLNAWNRARIRTFYGIDGSIAGDTFAHFCCCGAWAIAQESEEIRNGGPASSPRHVADKSGMDVELMANEQAGAANTANGATTTTNVAPQQQDEPEPAGSESYAD